MNLSRRYIRFLEKIVADNQAALIQAQNLIKQLYTNQGMLDKKINQTYALARACAQVLIEADIEEAGYIN